MIADNVRRLHEKYISFSGQFASSPVSSAYHFFKRQERQIGGWKSSIQIIINWLRSLQMNMTWSKSFVQQGVPDRMPFILNTDGSYDLQLNRFLRELPHNGVLSWHSWKSYALDLLTWCRFLRKHRNTTVWKATRAALIVYHQARRGGLVPLSSDPMLNSSRATSISAASWNRSVAALDKFYQWARQESYISVLPFTYREAHHMNRHQTAPVQQNTALERAARRQDTKFLTMDAYVFFRDVGLRGRLPSGAEDSTFCGRNGERNATFAELLVTTGLRLTEANSLVLPELPEVHEPLVKSVPFVLASSTAKGQKSRKIYVPTRIMRQIASYQEIERANALVRGHQAGIYEHWPNTSHLPPKGGKGRQKLPDLAQYQKAKKTNKELSDV